MKKRYLNISLILTSIALTCASCDSVNNQTISESFLACYTPFKVSIQGGKQEDLDYIKDIALKVDYLCNTTMKKNSPHGDNDYFKLNNVEYINSHPNELVKIDPWLNEILTSSLEYCNSANNKISIFLGKTKELWTEVSDKAHSHHVDNEKLSIPTREELNKSIEDARDTKLEFRGEFVKKIGNAHIDLGAFAKGYILEKSKAYLESKKLKNYIINGGNSAILLGEKKNGQDFRIGMANFKTKYITAKNCAISVSSMSEQAFNVNGERYSHLINCETGIANCPTPYVLLKGNNAFELDAFSTACCFFENNKEMSEFLSKYKIDYIVSKDEKNISYKSDNIKVENK